MATGRQDGGQQFDKDSDKLIEATAKGDVYRRLQMKTSDRKQELGHCNMLIEQPSPVKTFDSGEPLLNEEGGMRFSPWPKWTPCGVFQNLPFKIPAVLL